MALIFIAVCFGCFSSFHAHDIKPEMHTLNICPPFSLCLLLYADVVVVRMAITKGPTLNASTPGCD